MVIYGMRNLYLAQSQKIPTFQILNSLYYMYYPISTAHNLENTELNNNSICNIVNHNGRRWG